MNRYFRKTIARQTGRPIIVGHAEELGLDACDGDTMWYTVCLDHFGMVGHRTLALAKSHAADPLGWCERCQSLDEIGMATTAEEVA
jgi:hypothetical protein